jgi:hypothetical protein
MGLLSELPILGEGLRAWEVEKITAQTAAAAAIDSETATGES